MKATLLLLTGVLGSVAALAALPNYDDPVLREKRRSAINPVAVGDLRLVPTYCSCSVTWGAAEAVDGLAVEWRKAGGTWQKADPAPVFYRESSNYRCSLFRLEEDTEYETRYVCGRNVLADGRFRTWKSDVPVAETVYIDSSSFKPPYKIKAKGRPSGWIRYTVKSGTVLENNTGNPSIIVGGAEYVLIDDIVFRGGNASTVIWVADSKGVRIRNCEISHWGHVAAPRYDLDGKCYYVREGREKKLTALDWDAAIRLNPGTSEVTVERCFVHDPVANANSWRYSHPAGPEAVAVVCVDHSTVIRWCDFVGSDLHRWNDAVECGANFHPNGGFNRDADVYGNFMIFSNDDNMEADGGQQNVRIFDNRFEAAISGVSIQGCMVSPVYVFDNLFCRMGEAFGRANPPVKMDYLQGPEARAFIRGNTFLSPHVPLCLQSTLACDIRDNRFGSGTPVIRLDVSKGSVVKGNVVCDALVPDAELPRRPLGFVLSKAVVDVGKDLSPVTLEARATQRTEFVVRKPDDADWFEVSPASGVLLPDEKTEFRISFAKSKMQTRRDWRGAFLVRTKEGLSRPVSVSARGLEQCPLKPAVPAGETAVYAFFDKTDGSTEKSVSFDVAKPARYWLLAHGEATEPWPTIETAVGSEAWRKTVVTLRSDPTWCVVPHGKSDLWGNKLGFFDLQAGKFTMRFRKLSGGKPFSADGLVLTTAPGAFEPL